MTNTFAVCLVAISVCCFNLSLARQIPKECTKGLHVWCQSLKHGADCGAVDHCTATVWEKQNINIRVNEVSDKFVRLLKALKRVKDILSEEDLAIGISSECNEIQYPAIAEICKENTAKLEKHLLHVLKSDTSAETACHIVGMCNNILLDTVLSMNERKTSDLSTQNELMLSNSRCSLGPSYWCSNFSTSHECQTIHHCITLVWSTNTYPEDNDNICKNCVNMMLVARDEIEEEITQDEMKNLIEKLCKRISIKAVAHQCANLIDEYANELMEMLSSKIEPQAACSVVGLCNNAKIDALILEYECPTPGACPQVEEVEMLDVSFQGKCLMCLFAVERLQNMLNDDHSEGNIRNVLENLCASLSSNEETSCVKFVDEYTNQLTQLLTGEMSAEQICIFINQCALPSLDHRNVLRSGIEQYHGTSVKGSVMCTGCTVAVDALRKLIQNNENKVITILPDAIVVILKLKDFGSISEKIKKVVHELCDHAPDALKTKCNDAVTQYADIVIILVIQQLGTDELCSAIKLCKSNDSTLYTFKETIEAFHHVTTPNGHPTESHVKGTSTCSSCKFALQMVRDQIAKDENKEKLKKVIDGLCNYAPELIKSTCHNYVAQFADFVIVLVAKRISPDEICSAISLCQSSNFNYYARKGICKQTGQLNDKCLIFAEAYFVVMYNIFVSNQKPASVCKIFGVRTDRDGPISPIIAKELAVKMAEKEKDVFAETMRITCGLLPVEINVECKRFVTSYGPAVIALVVEEVGLSTVCPQVKRIKKVNINSQNSNCPLCLFAVEKLEDTLKVNRSVENIRNSLDGLCGHLSRNLRTECINFVEAHSNELTRFLVSGISAQEICSLLKMCKIQNHDSLDVTQSEVDIHLETAVIPVHTADEHHIESNVKGYKICLSCKFVLKMLHGQIEGILDKEKIKNTALKVCDHMPKFIRNSCYKYVNKYSDTVVEWLQSGVKYGDICNKIKLCGLTDIEFNALQETAVIPVHTVDERHIEPNVKGFKTCLSCKFVLKMLHGQIEGILDKEKIKQTALKVCDHVPKFIRNSCYKYVNEYSDTVVDWLQNGVTYGDICSKIKLCGLSEIDFNSLQETAVIPVDTADDRHIESNVKGFKTCLSCKFVLKMLHGQIEGILDKEKIKQTALKVCDHVPKFIRNSCYKYVNEYSDTVVDWLQNGVTYGDICSKIKLCGLSEIDFNSLQETAVIPVDTADDRHIESNVKGFKTCLSCKFVLKMLHGQIEGILDKEKIKQTALKVCDHVPKFIRNSCYKYVNEYSDTVVDWLQNGVTYGDICSKIKLCGLSEIDFNSLQETAVIPVDTADDRHIESNVKGFKTCLSCKFVLKMLHGQIEGILDKEKIKQTALKVCDHVPKFIRNSCYKYVNEYSDTVVDWLQNGVTYGDICSKIKLCGLSEIDFNSLQETAVIPVHTSDERHIESNVKGYKICLSCKFVLKMLHGQIEGILDKEKIKNTALKVCDHMPKFIRNSCYKYVNKYSDTVVDWLQSGVKYGDICNKIKLCGLTDIEFNALQGEMSDCAVCKTIMMAVQLMPDEYAVGRNIGHADDKSCNLLSSKYSARCYTLLELYGNNIIHLIEAFGSKRVCQKIDLCNETKSASVHKYRAKGD